MYESACVHTQTQEHKGLERHRTPAHQWSWPQEAGEWKWALKKAGWTVFAVSIFLSMCKYLLVLHMYTHTHTHDLKQNTGLEVRDLGVKCLSLMRCGVTKALMLPSPVPPISTWLIWGPLMRPFPLHSWATHGAGAHLPSEYGPNVS